jgi:D-alanyl-D-alanine carboxypeptidase
VALLSRSMVWCPGLGWGETVVRVRRQHLRPTRPGFGRIKDFLILGAVLAVGCLVAGAAPASPATATPTSSPSDAPGSALRPITQEELQALINENARALRIPGAVVLLRTPQDSFTVTYGTTRLDSSRRPTASTRFRIASNTKTMTSAVVLQLAQAGRLSLNDPVSKYVSGVPNGKSITIADLLDMRSGLYNYTDDPLIASSIDSDPTKVWTTQQLLAIASAHPRNSAPDTTFEYNNTNYLLLGLVIESVDHRSLAQAMQDRLFGPLGMKNTLLPAATTSTIPPPFSHGYLYGSSSVALTGNPPYTEAQKAAIVNGSDRPKDYTDVNHSFAAAAGGVVSDANDLATWIKALVSGRLFSPKFQHIWFNSIQQEEPDNPKSLGYGYGITRLQWRPNTIYFHGGETPGYNSFIGYDPTNRVTLVVWTNLTVSFDEAPTANALMLKVLDRIYKVSPLAPQAAAALAPTSSPSAEP